jgi:hypothetical protein
MSFGKTIPSIRECSAYYSFFVSGIDPYGYQENRYGFLENKKPCRKNYRVLLYPGSVPIAIGRTDTAFSKIKKTCSFYYRV